MISWYAAMIVPRNNGRMKLRKVIRETRWKIGIGATAVSCSDVLRSCVGYLGRRLSAIDVHHACGDQERWMKVAGT